jgi:1,2-diacylglycerol 3-beta-galactosyltransferase
MDQLMRASDIIVTKGGPGSIAEAVISGLPILISGFLPHEEGNVSFVVEGGMGSYCKDPEALRRHLSLWLSSPIELADMARASHRAGRPRASLDIARDILDILESHTACSGPECDTEAGRP